MLRRLELERVSAFSSDLFQIDELNYGYFGFGNLSSHSISVNMKILLVEDSVRLQRSLTAGLKNTASR